MTPNAHCPRPHCKGILIKDMDMDGTIIIKCMSCARTFGRVNGSSYSETLALMSESPGVTATTTLERFEDIQAEGKRYQILSTRKRQRIQDKAFAEAVAQRLGISLQGLQNASKRQDDQARLAEAITELHMLGLTAERIAEVLERHVTSIRRRLAGLKAGKNHL